MTKHQLSDALLNLDGTSPSLLPDPRQLTRDILAGDRRRVRFLAALAIVFWMIAAAGLLLLVLSLHWFIRSVRIQEFEHNLPWRMEANPGTAARPSPHPPIQPYLDTGLLHHSIPVIIGSLAALFLAALCTVLLVLSSRRATLRQLNASLVEICEQLKQMRQAAGAGLLRET